MSDLYASHIPGPSEHTADRTQASGASHSFFDSEINLRAEIAALIADNGHWVILRRLSSHPCPNYDPTNYEEHPSSCPYCMGMKFMYQDYLVKAYSRLAVDVEAQAKERRHEVGYMTQGKYVYYFNALFTDPHSEETKLLDPTDADYILEIELDENGEVVKTPQIKEVLNVQFVQALRERKGRVEYYALHCSVRPTGR